MVTITSDVLRLAGTRFVCSRERGDERVARTCTCSNPLGTWASSDYMCTEIRDCPFPGRCPGLGDSCVEGSTDDLCANCMNDWYKFREKCKPCNQNFVGYAAAALAATLGILLFFFFSDLLDPIMISALKSFFTTLQFISISRISTICVAKWHHRLGNLTFLTLEGNLWPWLLSERIGTYFGPSIRNSALIALPRFCVRIASPYKFTHRFGSIRRGYCTESRLLKQKQPSGAKI